MSSLHTVQQARRQREVPWGQSSWPANQGQVGEAGISCALVPRGAEAEHLSFPHVPCFTETVNIKLHSKPAMD